MIPLNRLLLLSLAFQLSGCALSHAEVEAIDPAVAADEVRAALESVAVAETRAGAEEAWRLAHQQFERGLQAAMREGCGERSVTELEYGFGQVGAALRSGATSASVAALLEALDERLACTHPLSGPRPASEED